MDQYFRRANTSYTRREQSRKKAPPKLLDISPRMMAVIGACVFGFLALVLAVSISSSLFDVPKMKSPVGDFIADAYGILSFIIPAYFIFAAAILLDTTFRPRMIFILNSIIFPFLTLSAGFSFLRDFDQYAARMSFFSVLGRNGFNLLIVAFTMLECFIIYALSTIFFPALARRKRERPPSQAATTSAEQGSEIRVIRIPPAASETPRWPLSVPSTEMGDVYTTAFEHLRRHDTYQPSLIKTQEIRNNLVEFPPAVVLPDTLSSFKTEETLDTLDENLQALNERLVHLSSDMVSIDAQFNALDTKIETLSSDIKNINKNTGIPNIIPSQKIGAFAGDDVEELETLEEDNPAIPAMKQNTDAEMAVSRELEQIIGQAEEEARRKTEEAAFIRHSREALKKNRWMSHYEIPVDGILEESSADQYWIIDNATKKAACVLTETLREFNIEAEVTGIRKGPVITSFEILPSPGVKLSKIVNLQDNIALRLAAASVRIVAPIPGKHAVGIEIPNKERSIVSFREIIEGELKSERRKGEIPIILGKDITGEAVTADLATMPHLLIAGSTGSGKSVSVNTMILSILYQCPPSCCRLILIDPKIVELKLYNDIPHLLTPVITEPKRAFQALQYCIYEMERRYACLDNLGVRDIKTYNKRIKERHIAAEKMPYIVVVIDEFADLMATTGKELESTVARLAAMSRAVGIHLVLATQRPSIDVITGLIKSNIPSRIAFMVASMMDSRIIIDTAGAEKLLGKGDMLYSGVVDPFPIRMQGAFVSEDEVERVVEYVKTLGEPDYIDEEMFFEDEAESSLEYTEGSDPLYEKAMEIVIQQGKASASYIQRRLKIGYNRAARLVEEMEHHGIVGPAQGSRPRELLRAV